MMFLSLIATAITLLITTFFLIETSAVKQDLRSLTNVPAQIGQKTNVGDEIKEDNEDFKIIRLKSTNSYIVFVKREPFVEKKQMAEEWFDVNFSDTDICDIKITFISPKKATYRLSSQDVTVEGCTVPSGPSGK